MKTEVTRRFSFQAAHSLPNHDGRCKNLHGHSYALEVSVAGPIIESGPKEGMVIDFDDINSAVEKEVLSQWDHKFLNEVVPFPSSAENLAREVYERLRKTGIPVSRVRMYETVNEWAEYAVDPSSKH